MSMSKLVLALLGWLAAASLNASCPNAGLRLLQRSTSNQRTLSTGVTSEDPDADFKRAEDARFLIQASFGPTLASLDSLSNISYRDWIEQQISLPTESHREYYRTRVNPRTLGSPENLLHAGSARPKCEPGSRWVSYVLLASDEGKPIRVQNNKIYVDGIFRSDIDPAYVGNGLLHPEACSDKAPDSWVVTCAAHAHKMSYSCKYQSWQENLYCQKTCYDQGVGYEGYDCSPGWPALSGLEGYICEVGKESVGAWVLLSSASTCDINLQAMLNPRVWRTSAATSSLNVVILKPGVLVLSSDADCSPQSDVLQSDIEVAGGFYMAEERMKLAENTLAEPATSESWTGGSCPAVPRTFLNEDSCRLLPGCRPLGATNFELELKTETLETFFSQAGRYVYAIKGLRTYTSPCGTLSRWRKLDCNTEICEATSLEAATADTIAAKLQSSSGFLRDIEVSCQDVPAAAVVLVGSSYFQHVHLDEYNVYDFTEWVGQHPGGPDKITQWTNMGFELIFPSWHPMERWEGGIAAEIIRPNFIGKYSSVVMFQDLPQPLQTQELLVALGAEISQEELSAVCGSPGEVANDPVQGHQLSMMHGDDLRDNNFDTDYENSGWGLNRLSKSTVWTMKALYAEDQLRQRMAWALSQVFVASVDGVGFNDRTEMWLNFYDIFVRNAFGNFRDILREVTYSPIMGDYLTYEGNRAFDNLASFPDENYAREIMQLFTIGLWKLNPDGSRQLDAQGQSIPTYSNEHIMNFARVFTGFDEQPKRSNVEEVDAHNYIDPMQMKGSWHDVYPKPDLNDGFLGDGYPTCSDLPAHAYLRAGAKFEFLGHFYEGGDEFHVLETSDLYQALCLSPGNGLPCRFNLTVELQSTLACHASECQADAVRILHVGTGFYEYIPPTCVDLYFFNGQTTDHGASRRRSRLACMNPKKKVAGTACCKGCTNKTNGFMSRNNISCENAAETYPAMYTKKCSFSGGWASKKYCQLACWNKGVGYDGDDCSFGAWRGEQVCSYLKEPVLFASAEQRCQDLGLEICDVGLPGYGCGFDNMPVWKKEGCSHEVIVHPDGKVSFTDTDKASLNKFWVPWRNHAYPGNTGSCPSDCTELPQGCSCAIQVEEVMAFDKTPQIEELLARLKIAAYPPTGSCTMNCSDEVHAYLVGSSIDSATVFEHEGQFYRNIEALVRVGSYSFRNPPAFMSSEPRARQALAEVESLLDHLVNHENTPVFISHRLIQRLVTSNPSPGYVEAVANAFKTGSYEGTVYSGTHGDLAATVAAILLHPEARDQETKSNGLLREPLLKLMHFLRSMQYVDKAGRPVVIENLMERIGQWPLHSPSVFNFYSPEHAPDAFPEDLVAPEFEIFTPPLAINFANGMMSLIDHGLGPCDKGFGDDGNGCTNGKLTLGELECVQPTIDQLDLLLTGGRLSSKDKVKAAYLQAEGADQYKALQKAIVMSPEFHTLGRPLPGTKRQTSPVVQSTEALRPYKAVVMLFLSGGADTFNMLVPLNCPLYDEYHQIRNSVALAPEELHQISTEGQACDFGIHSALPFVKELYDLGQAAFVSNIGALAEPLTKETYKGQGQRTLCKGLFSHSDQRRAAQTLTCQTSTASSKGAGGRLADALAMGTHGFKTNSFSVAGASIWPQGFETVAEVIDKESGAVRLEQYNQLKTVVQNMTSVQHGNVYCEEYARSFAKAIEFNEELASQLRSAELQTDFKTPTGLAEQLKQVARLMVAHETRKVERDVFFVSLGGFDTHQDVFDELAGRFKNMNEALSNFVTELKAQGLFDSTVLLTHSDFGRTLTPNSGEGTDHAWAGNHIMLGGALRGGRVFNEFPESLLPESPQDAGRGRLIPKYPWESMMVPVARWLGVEESQESSVFPNIANFNQSFHIIPQADMFS